MEINAALFWVMTMLTLSQILAWNGGGKNNFTDIANQGGYTTVVHGTDDEVKDNANLESLGRFFNELK
jgi:hypothetical protein